MYLMPNPNQMVRCPLMLCHRPVSHSLCGWKIPAKKLANLKKHQKYLEGLIILTCLLQLIHACCTMLGNSKSLINEIWSVSLGLNSAACQEQWNFHYIVYWDNLRLPLDFGNETFPVWPLWQYMLILIRFPRSLHCICLRSFFARDHCDYSLSPCGHNLAILHWR